MKRFASMAGTSAPSSARERGRTSKLQLLEDELGDIADDGHDAPPEPWRVDCILALVYRLDDVAADLARRGDDRRVGLEQAPGHRRVDEAGLDRRDADVALGQPLPQPLAEGGEPRLGRAIHVVALPPAIAGNRRDDAQEA